ncbi:uncharacterized protein LOC120689930 isoform X2 [Panicum virgatum]|uniref:uncharacterized protein LOC120689930 isoform X2 n=1 Tax=Panicum virgatum TaxID=38727 RepID=UPI0019D5D6F5|nr:uncharacterized protein LOC120689930 isoform X2 [Panicum virgatum]XP_039828419.1 uncharacterized protein LOC120689930 isoform X2 [Panicum virgatum]XP_039828425.1 uncharacterized protein LOC120689930 isoform X2 [Panicum virgatum]
MNPMKLGFQHPYTKGCLDGAWQSLDQTIKLQGLDQTIKLNNRCVEEEGAGFSIERAVRQSLYWPDGTIRKRTKSYIAKKSHNQRCLIAQALVDKYNEDYNLLKDDAYKLKDVLNCSSICEKRSLYYHLNFTTSKVASPKNCSMDNLNFAEVKHMPQGQHVELLITCFCTVNPNDNGQHCYGCTNRGHADMKHPDSSVEYIAGHLDVGLPCDGFAKWSDSDSDDVKYVKAREAVLRRQYKDDQERVIKRLMTLPPGVTIVDG